MEICFNYDGKVFASKKFSIEISEKTGNSYFPVYLADELKDYLYDNGLENLLRNHASNFLLSSKRHEDGAEVYTNQRSGDIYITFKDSKKICFHETRIPTSDYVGMYQFVFANKNIFKAALENLDVNSEEAQNEKDFDRFLTY